jgi:RHS repeat-associated protein
MHLARPTPHTTVKQLRLSLQTFVVIFVVLSACLFVSPKMYAQAFAVSGTPVGDSYDYATVTQQFSSQRQCYTLSLPVGLFQLDRIQAPDLNGFTRWWQGIQFSGQYCYDPNNFIPLYIGAREVAQETTYNFSVGSTQLQVTVEPAIYSFSPSTQNADPTNNPYPAIVGTRNKVIPTYTPGEFLLPYTLTSPNCDQLPELDSDGFVNEPQFAENVIINDVIHYMVDDSQFTFYMGPPSYSDVFNLYTLNDDKTCNFSLTYNSQIYPGNLTVVYTKFSQDTGDTEGCDDCSDAGAPINLSNGNTWIAQADYSIPGLGGGLSVKRTWNSLWPKMGPPSTIGLFGNSWTSDWEQQLQFSLSEIGLWRGNGSEWIFTWNGDANAYTVSSPPDEKATLVGNGDGTYTVTLKDGFQYIFDSNGRLKKTQDRNGNGRTLTWSGTKLTSVADDAGRSLAFAYNDPVSSNLVTSVLFGTKVVANYFYTPDANHYLTKVTYPDTAGYNFQYLATTDPALQGLIEQVQDTNNKVLEAHTYDPYRRGLTSGRADVDGTGPVEGITVTYDFFSGEGTVTNSLGDTTFVGFNYIGRRGYVSGATGPGCVTCGSRGMNWFSRDDSGRVLTHYVPTTNAWDPLHGINVTYDDNNNIASVTEMLQDAIEVGSLQHEGDGRLVLAHNRASNDTHTKHSHRSAHHPRFVVDKSDLLTKDQAKTLTSQLKAILEEASESSPRHDDSVLSTPTRTIKMTSYDQMLAFDLTMMLKPVSLVNGNGRGISSISALMLEPFAVLQDEPPPIDPNVKTWSYTYNNFAEVLTQTDPLGNVTTNTYDDHGNLLSTTTPDSGVTSYTYDSHGNILTVTDPRGNVTQMTYNAIGQIATVTDAQHQVTSYEYDGEGNRTASVDAGSNRTQFSYDTRNRLIGTLHPDSTTEAITYDLRGRKTSATARGVTTTYEYDDADRVTSVTNPSGTTSYTYDTEDEITSVTDALSNITTYTWGAPSWGAGRRVLQTTFPSGAIETYQYDNAGRLNLVNLRDGGSVSTIYDKFGRMTQKSFSDSTGTNTGTISYTYDLDNHPTQVTDPNSSSTYTYDVMGRKVSSATEYALLPSMTFILGYAYDKDSNRTQMIYPDGQVVNYVYDSLNRLGSLTDSEAGAFTFGYDNLGRRTSLTRPNGVSTTYTYDAGSKLLSLTHQGTAVLDGTAYLYDGNANRSQRIDSRTQTVDQYTYDTVNQLVRVDESTPTTDLAVKERFLYDAVGNRLGANTSVNTYGPSNELLSTPTDTYTYDTNNNLSTSTDSGSSASTSYTWDALGSMLSAQGQNTVTFAYDYQGRRIAKNSTYFVYDGTDIVTEVNSAGTTISRFIQSLGTDEHLADRQDGQWFYYEQDALGNVTSLTDNTGTVAAGYTYSSFGVPTQDVGTLDQPYRFTGREWDSETGLYFYRARYIDASIGRFISEDPIRFAAGVDFYRYAMNNPTRLTDPTGFAPPCLNVKNFVDFMNAQDKGRDKSTSNCAQSVKNGLDAGFGGKQGETLHGGPQNYGPGLQQLGFTPISNTSPLKPGDIMLFQPPSKNDKWGHIQMWNGTNWLSDYIQRNLPDGYPGPGTNYEKANPAYQLYRDTNICPQ